MMMVLILLFVAIAISIAVSSSNRNRQVRAGQHIRQVEIDGAKRLAEEDVTVFGEELQNLHIETMTTTMDTAMRQDYQRALNSYETAKERLATAQSPEQVKSVTHALEDGRYAMACVLARQAGEPLPVRRPPCFFNPQHGPSTEDVTWAPPGGQQREIPVCAADAERVRAGAEPDIRTVEKGYQSVPYWRAGPAYQPYAMGYYSPYADLMPAFFVMTMLNSAWMGGMVNDFDSGYDAGYDSGYDQGYGDAGGDSGGGDSGGGDSGGGDSGGGDGGWGGGDSGGGDGGWGGGDFGGGDFGGGFSGGDFGF